MSATSDTRVCIKNLPLHTFEQDLKEFLVESIGNTKLEITDCKVLKNAKGKSRKVAFVGFRDASQAKMVVEKFDKAFMRMSRLSVQPALTKPEKKDEKAADVIEKKATDKNETGKAKTKTKKKPTNPEKKGSKFWGNDEGDENQIEHQVVEEKVVEVESSPKPDNSNRLVSEGESSDSSSSDESDIEDDMSVDAAVNMAKESAPVLNDMDFLRSKQSAADDLNEDADTSSSSSSSSSSSDSSSDDSSSSDSDSEEEENEKVGAADTIKNSQEMPAEKNTNEEIEGEGEQGEKDDENDLKEEAPQSRLFVRNLPFGTTEEELSEYFSSYGKVIECHVPMDNQMENNKGFAFVAFGSASDAFQARTELDKKDFQGRLLHILQARPAPSAPKLDDLNLTWKQRQELARKERETKGSEVAKGWSASFVRGDAVVDNLADKLGLRKGEILGVKDKLSSGDAAVRLALGETQIIEENRQYFKEHGVDMDALVSADSKDTKRSKTSILVKNLPYDTRVEDLSKLFQIGESTITVLLPPSRSIALVKYGHSADAKRAFKKLAYRRFKHVPIYLEWAPLAAASDASTSSTSAELAAGASPASTTATTATVPAKPAPQIEEQTENLEDEDTNADGTVSSTIYVKNLNFQTTEEILRDVFEKSVDGVRFVRIPQKTAPAKKGQSEAQSMSMGFGFVELSSQTAAEKAIKKLNGKMVDGHAWELSISSSRGKKATSTKTPKTGGKNPTKLIVRNVPFQATRTELLKLFGSFGQLRKVRLPKKFDGSHRGFAFVDFVTSKEAQEAMSSLSRTHLYGRHLVLEWATNEDQDVEMLREKAKRDTSPFPAKPQNKRIKFSD
ncbi:unnamed protein product [Cylindrotheca closterium]|uniref:RRM domain-containing protein n=1 Tax=Cylindrotheca closterium TaxID=2856 RepID=A0AAD2FDW7_9STRA|nr:unnamed protein product [Cylindrotheca closterium]